MAVQFLKKGAAAQAAIKHEEQKVEQAKQNAQNKVFRFWLPKDKDAKITFCDGELDTDGMLTAPMLYEHQLNINGSWKNWYPCTRDNEPCPICEGPGHGQGDRPYLAALFTIIDHSEYKDKNGVLHQNERRLFVAKRETLKQLQKIAIKRKGLAGCTFDVSRSGDKSASVGDLFDFVEKHTLAELKTAYKEVAPYKYDEVLKYYTADELKAMGFGKGQALANTGGVSAVAEDQM